MSAPESAAPARDRATRVADTRRRLEHDIDLWVATADAGGGVPGLVPLSFDWDGTEIMVVTPVGSPCGRNLRETGRARLGLGEFRDVVMVDASAREVSTDDVPEQQWQHYIERAEWDPREERPDYAVYFLRPERVQAWREANEIPGRTVMRDGTWLA